MSLVSLYGFVYVTHPFWSPRSPLSQENPGWLIPDVHVIPARLCRLIFRNILLLDVVSQ